MRAPLTARARRHDILPLGWIVVARRDAPGLAASISQCTPNSTLHYRSERREVRAPTTRPTIALAAFSGHLHHPGSGCTQGYAARRGDPGNPESADFFSSKLASSCDTSSGDVRTCGLLYREVPANATGVTRGQSRSARSLMLLVCLAILLWGIGDLLLEFLEVGLLSPKTVASILAARLTRIAVSLVTLPDSRTAPFLAALPIVLWLLARHTRRT